MNSDLAVCIKNARKRFGNLPVLEGVDMEVERGIIYGLLGPSGCGKTTLLNIVVGCKRLDAGDIHVLGNKLRGRGSNILGPRVGYMPQEIALVNSLTVEDTIFYFGRIYGMPDNLIAERYHQLHSLLELPPNDRYIENCSGGEKRRVSFAVAVVHKPELVILDEPTVGVDPLLREKLWQYFIELAKNENIAVIITTHYIEECRAADKIGLMREGKIIAENSPNTLLRVYNSQSLEEVFFLLSRKQDADRLDEMETTMVAQRENDSTASKTISDIEMAHGSTKMSAEEKIISSKSAISRRRLRAMLDKNWKQFHRNITGLVYFLLIPLSQVCLCVTGVGGNIKDIPLGVVNAELASCSISPISSVSAFPGTSCQFSNMSCRFLTYLNHPMISKVQYASIDEAKNAVMHGSIVGVLYIPENFSRLTEKRIDLGIFNAGDFADLDLIKVWMDMSNREIGEIVKYELSSLFMDFQMSIFDDCGFLRRAGNLPLNFNFFYGNNQDPYTIFLIPAILVTVAFLNGSIMTCQIIVTEKEEGIWNRTIVAGVTSLEITTSHFIFQACLAVFPIIEYMCVVFVLFQYTNHGSWWLLFLILYIMEFCGMAFGYFVSVVADGHLASTIILSGMANTMVITCGLIWPLEGMPPLLRLGPQSLPFTIPIESTRNVIQKGWTIDNFQVYDGILVCFLYIIIFGLLSMFLMNRQR